MSARHAARREARRAAQRAARRAAQRAAQHLSMSQYLFSSSQYILLSFDISNRLSKSLRVSLFPIAVSLFLSVFSLNLFAISLCVSLWRATRGTQRGAQHSARRHSATICYICKYSVSPNLSISLCISRYVSTSLSISYNIFAHLSISHHILQCATISLYSS